MDLDSDYQPEYLSFDAAADRYEADDAFLPEALDALTDRLETIDEPLRAALRAWYRRTDAYNDAVNEVIRDAEAG